MQNWCYHNYCGGGNSTLDWEGGGKGREHHQLPIGQCTKDNEIEAEAPFVFTCECRCIRDAVESTIEAGFVP